MDSNPDNLITPLMDARIQQIIDEWPPFTDEEIGVISDLLGPIPVSRTSSPVPTV